VRVDLNADLGELGTDTDARLIEFITSASLAAGFHAGTPSTLRATIRLAKAHGVAIGAHPSLADRAGFGRREMEVTVQDVEDLVLYQVSAVAGTATAEGARLQHVKPHGALYHMAARDKELARAIVRAMLAIDRSLILFAPPRSELAAAGQAAGVRVAIEAFVDRAYRSDGSLVDRSSPGALIEDVSVAVTRAVQIVERRSVVAVDGTVVPLDAETICLHGDTPGAVALAATLRGALEASGIDVRAVGDAST
jgi:UPF0271 protein